MEALGMNVEKYQLWSDGGALENPRAVADMPFRRFQVRNN